MPKSVNSILYNNYTFRQSKYISKCGLHVVLGVNHHRGHRVE